jgi:hypothetical protein
MLVARLTQDYYGFTSQSTLPNKQLGLDRPEPQSPRPQVLPAERLVEGELLRNRSKGTSNRLGDVLLFGRFVDDAANTQEGCISAQTAQRAVNTYLDYAASSSASGYTQSRTVDYYA